MILQFNRDSLVNKNGVFTGSSKVILLLVLLLEFFLHYPKNKNTGVTSGASTHLRARALLKQARCHYGRIIL